MEIRPLTDVDIPAALSLNEDSVLDLSPLTAADLERYRSMTDHVLVCEADGEVAAFTIAFPPGTAYGSLNYAWHAERFPDFLYLDRIAVGEGFRRRGIASLLYDHVEALAVPHGRMVCEVNSDPPNVASLAFHAARGYREVGHLRQQDGHETVMLAKPLGPAS